LGFGAQNQIWFRGFYPSLGSRTQIWLAALAHLWGPKFKYDFGAFAHLQMPKLCFLSHFKANMVICIFSIVFVFWYQSPKFMTPLNAKMPQWAPKWANIPE
jgi:hypothetical protein